MVQSTDTRDREGLPDFPWLDGSLCLVIIENGGNNGENQWQLERYLADHSRSCGFSISVRPGIIEFFPYSILID